LEIVCFPFPHLTSTLLLSSSLTVTVKSLNYQNQYSVICKCTMEFQSLCHIWHERHSKK